MALQDDGGSPCIDENTVLDFVQGRLDASEVARVDVHADGCLSCRSAIDEAVRAFRERATGFEGPPPAVVTRLGAGDRLAGRYRIVRFIARGGMGEVYEAEDEMLGTRIAVKTVAASISDNPLATRRLKQEVNLARRITHPNVCRIFDLGVHQSGSELAGPPVLFITMELIAGVSLAQRLRDAGPFSPAAALPIVRAMAAAIGAAHRAGVIHRDFKGENVMLAGEGDDVRVVVMDFGLARNTTLSTHDSLEGRGLAGTLAYMAPEQLDGQRAGNAADIYALGVVMYEMLTGQLPFVPPPGEPGLAVVLNRLSEPAPPLRAAIPNIEARWNDVVARCLEREVARRLPSADDVVRALADDARADVPAPSASGDTSARPAAAIPAAAQRTAGRRVGIVAAVGGLLALAVAVKYQSAGKDAAAVAPSPAAAATLAAPAAPPSAEVPPSAATQNLEAVAPPSTAPAVQPGGTPADLHEAKAVADRPPAARRPSAPRPLRRDQSATAAPPKRAAGAPPAAAAAEKDPPAKEKARRRSADPDDGFIFQ